MKIKPVLFVFITIIAFVFNCSKSDETYTIETIDGVRHVHNHAPLWGDEPKVALEFVQKIGELDTEDENYLLYGLHDIARDRNGNFYVLDSGNYRVQKFDSDWKYLSTFGRRGEGPGEFGSNYFLELDTQGNIFVTGWGGMKIQVLTPEGKYLKTIDVKPDRIHGLHLLQSGHIAYISNRQERFVENNKLSPKITIIDSEGNHISAFVEPRKYSNWGEDFAGNNINVAVDSNDIFYIAFSSQNRIEKFTANGKHLFTVDRSLNYTIHKPRRDFDNNGWPIIIKQAETQVSRAIGIDFKNRIWVATYTSQPDHKDNESEYLKQLRDLPDIQKLEIFNDDGILLGRIPIPMNFSHMHIIDDRIYFIDRESITIHEYKIVEK